MVANELQEKGRFVAFDGDEEESPATGVLGQQGIHEPGASLRTGSCASGAHPYRSVFVLPAHRCVTCRRRRLHTAARATARDSEKADTKEQFPGLGSGSGRGFGGNNRRTKVPAPALPLLVS